MKILLKISILLNWLALIGLISLMMAGRNSDRSSVVKPSVVANPVTANPLLGTSAAGRQTLFRVPQAPSSPFNWSQLYSSDYHQYVKNLRGIGCPEQTVRAIVMSDVESVYQVIGNGLEQRLAALATNSWSARLRSASTEQNLKDELQRMPDQEVAKIADLLGLKPAESQLAAATSSALAFPVSAPLVLQNIDLSTLKLNAEQKHLIADMRQNLLKQFGASKVDPNDSAYLARLQKARPEMDNILKSMIGTAAFEDYQIQAANALSEAAGKP